MHPISEKRLKLQEDKARARLYSAHAAIPEALGGTGNLPEQPAHLEPDDQATARAEARQKLADEKARARLEASGLNVPIEVQPDGSVWPASDKESELERLEDERLEDLRHELRVRLEEATPLEAKLLEELGSMGSRIAALEKRLEGFSLEKSIEAHEDLLSRVKVLEAVIDDSPEPSSNSRVSEAQPCGCDPGLSTASAHHPLLNFYACEEYPRCAYGASQP